MALNVPVLGTVDWKWFLAGILFSMFVLPFLLRMFRNLT